MNYLKTHLYWLAVIAVLGLCARSWLIEHDNRLLAQQQQKLSEADVRARDVQIADLKQLQAQTQQIADAQVKTLRSQLASIKTPAQALPVIAQIAPELHPVTPSDAAATTVTVEAIPLATTLTQCRTDAVQLGSCSKQLEAEKQIEQQQAAQLADKNAEIKALTKPHGFWARVKSGAKVFAIGVVTGVGLYVGGRL